MFIPVTWYFYLSLISITFFIYEHFLKKLKEQLLKGKKIEICFQTSDLKHLND